VLLTCLQEQSLYGCGFKEKLGFSGKPL